MIVRNEDVKLKQVDAGVQRKILSLEDSVILDIFTPQREDFLV